jgi:uncharacterized protein YdhG (YjbR/CyaY superfamily)
LSSFDAYLATLPEPHSFKASKNHLSVFPFSPEAVDAARAELAGFQLSKGTVRFTPDKPIPDAALEQLLRHRLREIEGR